MSIKIKQTSVQRKATVSLRWLMTGEFFIYDGKLYQKRTNEDKADHNNVFMYVGEDQPFPEDSVLATMTQVTPVHVEISWSL